MRRSPLVEPTPVSTLHPVLAAALSSLNAQLEEELTRYRRQRSRQPGRPPTAYTATQARPAPKPLDLIAIDAVGGRTRPAPAPAPTAEPPSFTDPDPWQSEVPAESDIASLALTSAELAPPAGTLSAASPAASAPEFVPEERSDPDDYLASSEELLKSLAEEEAKLRARQEPGLLKSLLTPLGIGSLLLLLLSSTMLGYVLLNPDSLKLVGLDRLLQPEASPPAEPAASDRPPAAPAYPDLSSEEFRDLSLDTLGTLPAAEQPSPLPTTPAAQIPAASAVPPQPAIGTLSQSRGSTAPPPAPSATVPPASTQRSLPPTTVPQTPPRPSAAPERRTARSATAAPAQPTRSAAPAPPSPQPRAAAPAQPARSPVPAPAPAPAPQQAAAPAPQDYYYVVTPYSGDRSLDQARQAVGDAYVRNFPSGAQVQMGAFTERSRAQALQQQLQQQGIAAEILEGRP